MNPKFIDEEMTTLSKVTELGTGLTLMMAEHPFFHIPLDVT